MPFCFLEVCWSKVKSLSRVWLFDPMDCSLLSSSTHGIFQARGLEWGAIAFSMCVWELDYKESWAPKNWCFWTVVLEKTLESPLDFKEIKPIYPKGNQSWIFIGRTMLELKLQYFGYLMWELIHWKRPWCCKRLKVGGEGDNRGWDGWMASPTQWTWDWANSGR